ncbi:cell division site-positioning protein MapZ family protein [Streptococcus acidominimus]|uniref:Mid-cell-anchored protein Z n=1 Tax=Streptococcus acidominimus TaxID=1326 RepID=A0A4Y9FPG7_STRAI|nr:cell division site-positioning protein MapZ family protein [Streptococcus acidominimus]MBF0818812.1 hypothetical protein [Streptococcus acidominimus]MBF0839191.1 hypothetical protein [Streptococcus acidominimus]MBF0849168.1 hypothetical protein [Streptococcus danieliae]TFU30762.1 hypothetical protein E4U01_05005 [Streptococcus acidominimus]
MVKNTEKNDGLPSDGEKILDFEDAKNMTVGQAVRKHEEIKAGVTEEDGLLDRYIKQHRAEIEQEKYETQMNLPVLTAEDVAEAAEVGDESENALDTALEEQVEALSIHKVTPETPTTEEVLPAPETAPFNDLEEEEERSSRKPLAIWLALALVFVTALALAFMWMKQSEKVEETPSSSVSSSQSSKSTSQSSSSSKEDEAVTAFNRLYETFFVDKEESKLKNSAFGQLPELKKALDKIDQKTSAYQTAKKKYEQLETAIKALQSLNNQFDKPIIVDGDLDTTATVKDGENLTPATTGISAVDASITAAINLGRSQQTASSAAPAANAVAPVAEATPPASVEPTAPAVQTDGASAGTGTAPLYGIAVPAGVTLQRHLSRVPYDQAKIDDVNNPAWTFNPGVLETIIAVSQERGYVSGYQYILERVNIINGNGYYNLFRPDGTYLFSMNAKTGYFVGNGAGYADDLDY